MSSKLLDWNPVARDWRASQVAGGILPTIPKSMKPILPSRSTRRLPACKFTNHYRLSNRHALTTTIGDSLHEAHPQYKNRVFGSHSTVFWSSQLCYMHAHQLCTTLSLLSRWARREKSSPRGVLIERVYVERENHKSLTHKTGKKNVNSWAV